MKKYLKLGPYGFIAALFVLFAALLRILLIAQNWPYLNSDEGTMGLEALHIAYHSELPIFLYGQGYMGTLEAYTGAVLYHIFGVSSFSLRLGLILIFLLFLSVMYVLTCFLYDKRLAVISLLVLSLGNANIFTREVAALGGAVETLLFGSLVYLLTSWLVVSYKSDSGSQEKRKRALIYGGLGLSMGLGFWSASLIIPFILVALVLLLFFCRSELFSRPKRISRLAVVFLLGVLIGVMPLLIYDIQYPAQNIIAVTLHEHGTGGLAASFLVHYSIWQQLGGMLLIDLPTATGAYPLCAAPAQQALWPQEISCMGFQGIWGAGVVLLWIIATGVLIFALYRAVQVRRATPSPVVQEEIARLACRLGLLGCVFCTMIIYTFSPAPALAPFTSQRYLIGLLIATPTILAPLVASISLPRRALALLWQIAGKLALISLLAVLLFGTLNVFTQQVPELQAGNQQESSLIHDLLAIHATDIYSDYWTCDRIIFLSDEHVVCAVIDSLFRVGQNRYLPYLQKVQQDPGAAYVFATGSAESAAVARLAARSPGHYRRFVFDGFTTYQPLT